MRRNQPELRQVLASFKRAVNRLTDSEGKLPDDVLCALLLTVAAGSSAETDCKRLFELAEHLSPGEVRGALPLPSQQALATAQGLLPLAPYLVAEQEPHMLGFLYQFACAPKRVRAQQAIQTANKSATLAQIISFTQLHTPAAIICTLLDEAIPENIPCDFRLLDPAVGAGNFFVAAFDKLTEKLPAPEALQRLFGCDIDRTALWVTCLAIASRVSTLPGAQTLPSANLSLVLKDNGCELGSLDRQWPKTHCLHERYDAVVGNPPYLGRKLLSRQLKDTLRLHYPDAHQDLCAAFIARGLELLKPGGRLAYITQSSLLFLPSYQRLRERLAADYKIVRIEEAGTGVFPLQTGEKVNSVLLSIENNRPPAEHRISFIDRTAVAELDVKQSQLALQPKATFNYRCPAAFIHIHRSAPPLNSLTEVRQGLATSDNKRFIKHRWEVPEEEIGVRWIPYAKGGGSERWYAPIDTVVDWEDNGAAIKRAVAEAYPYLMGKVNWVVKNEHFYMREGLTFSLVNTSQLAVRYLPPGCIFDVGGSSVFPDQADRWWLLAYLNSSFVGACAELINPTINFQVGDLKQLPVVSLAVPERQRLARLAEDCTELKKQWFSGANSDPTSSIRTAEAEIDELVLWSAKRSQPYTGAQWQAMERLCTAAASRRKQAARPTDGDRSGSQQVLSNPDGFSRSRS